MGDSPLRVLDPRALPDELAVHAPSLHSLRGAKVALLWNNRPKGDVVLNGLASALADRYGVTTIFKQKLRVGTGAPAATITEIVHEARAAIVGVGD